MKSYERRQCGVWDILKKQGCSQVLTLLKSDVRSFNGLRKETSASSNTISSRLRELRDYKVVEAFAVPDGEKVYKMYRLTDRGASLVSELEKMLETIDKIVEER